MARYVKVGVAVGSLLALPLACGTEFHACEGAECDTTTGGGSAGTTGLGGTSAAGSGGSVTTNAASTTGQGGTTGTTGGFASGGEGGDPEVGGSSGAGGSPPTCGGELLPGDDACVVDEEYGVFVSPGGDDTTGDGTREAPFATLQMAAYAASQAEKRVYACATGGDYAAGLSLMDLHDGLELYGSFDCDDWSYDGDLRANVAPDAGVALSVSEIETSLELDGFTFESADATIPGGSSVAALVQASSGVVLRNVVLRAGAGVAGAPGVTVNFTYPEKSELDGVDGSLESGGVSAFVACPNGDQTRGGVGGVPDPTEPSDGFDGSPNHEGPGGEGGIVGTDCTPGIGKTGANGPSGSDGPGAPGFGELSDGRWQPAAGSDGNHGPPGQGGGGGAGAANGGGGSGGAGGCGGAGGKAGGGGGASIALVLVDSEVTLVDSDVAAGDAGDGGAGSSGQEGQQEFGSSGDGYEDACDGGRGGLGGNGGAGGGGAGGISVGILVEGTWPTLTNTDVAVGSEGLAGDGAGTSNDGVLGIAQPELNLADL